jgi:hypothetical protein
VTDAVRPGGRTWVHLVGFGVLAALAMFFVKGPPVDEQNRTRVTFTAADLAQVGASFERTWSRPPTALELQRAFEQYVRSEVLYREALERGLDRNDPVVKLSLVRKITMLGTAAAQAAEPTDEELRAFFELRAERYRVPASLSLQQVYLDRDRRADSIDADAKRLLSTLLEQDPRPEELREIGDSLMLPGVVEDVSEGELARTFGEEFREAVVSLPVGPWQGPVESAFGLHLVKITEREDSRIPDWTEVRDRVMSDLVYEGRGAAEDQFYAEVLPRYEIVYEDDVIEILEGQAGSDAEADGS